MTSRSVLERARKKPRLAIAGEARPFGIGRKSAVAEPVDVDSETPAVPPLVTPVDLDVGEPPDSHDAASDLDWLSTGARPDWLKTVTRDLIAQYALKPLTEDDVAVFKLRVAGTAVDRDNERFSLEVLEDFQQTLPGKSLLVGHEWGPPGIGRIVDAGLVEAGTDVDLYALAYLVRGAGLDDVIKQIEGGTIWAVSIGFFAPQRVVGSDGVAVYTRGPNGERAEAIEASLVFLGAQVGASIVKAFASGARCERCGHAEASCELSKDFALMELENVTHQIRRKRHHPVLVTETFAELHSKQRRLELELEEITS
jgi:hypothetical protein